MTWKQLELNILNTLGLFNASELEGQAADVLKLTTAAAIAHDKAKDELETATDNLPY